MTADAHAYFHRSDYRKYDFGGGHAFNPIREELTLDLVRQAALLSDTLLVSPDPATDDELTLFHDREYIEAVKSAGRGVPLLSHRRFGLGSGDNPIFFEMHEASAARVGGTLRAVRDVVEGRLTHAANFGGGLHHALPDRASGFCIYNDIGVAIKWLRKVYDARVAYVDLDAHHGDGVQWAFYRDPDVLTISIHESGRFLFPGTGHLDEIGEGKAAGTSVNVPLQPHTDGENWLACVEAVVPDVVAAFRPDILITQHGCDPHRLDPLTHLDASVQAFERAARLLDGLAHDLCGGRWIALGGGGYSVWDVVPRAWGLVWAALTHRQAPQAIPAAWIEEWRDEAPQPLPARWHDEPELPAPKDGADVEREWRTRENLKTAATAREIALRHLRPS